MRSAQRGGRRIALSFLIALTAVGYFTPIRQLVSDLFSLELGFVQAFWLWLSVLSTSQQYAVADGGLKCLGMDHGNPSIEAADIWFCSDEHLTFAPHARLRVGDRIRVTPAHVDPTLAYHERVYLVRGEEVLDEWAIDLRGW